MRLPPQLNSWLNFSSFRYVLIVLMLSGGAIALNHLRLPLFFGIEFLFGSTIAVLALVLLGSKAGIIVGTTAAAVTLFAWGHPYAWLVFSLEIIWLSWRWREDKNVNLVLQDLQFWLLLGLPLIVFAYVFMLDTSWHTAGLVSLKQMTNGVFNTLLASLILLLMQLHRGIAQHLSLSAVSLRQLLFSTLMALTLVSGSVPLILDARKQQAEYELSIANRLLLLADLLQYRLNTISNTNTTVASELSVFSQQLKDKDIAFAVLDDHGKILHAIGTIHSINPQQSNKPQQGFAIWFPEDINLRLQRWRQSRYFLITKIGTSTELSYLIVEQGAAEIVKKLEQDSTRQLLLLVCFMLLSMAISSILSKVISAPLRKIVATSKKMQDDIAHGRVSAMPASNVAEYSSLGKSLWDMSQDLSSKFNTSKETQSDLAEQVADRTLKLQQSNSQLEAILSAASDFSIIATDQQGVVSYFSSGAEKLTGYSAAELVQRQTPAILHLSNEVAARAAELSEKYQQPVIGFKVFVIEAEQKGSDAQEWHYVRKDGQQVLVSLTVSAIKDSQGQITGYLGVAKDISERHRNEKIKNEFISTVSHELRTPLTSIYGSLKLVNSGVLAELPPKVSKLLQVAEVNSQRLAVLINDLLDIEKLLAGKMQLELKNQALAPIIDEAMQAISSYAEQYQIKIFVVLPEQALYAKVDTARLIQVMQNLLSNAIKFSEACKSITVKLSQAQSNVKLEVIDQGVGIADEFKSRIFERFTQSDAASTRKQGGTGLGLAISKELTLHMGGEIGFASELGAGATFWLSFPLNMDEGLSE